MPQPNLSLEPCGGKQVNGQAGTYERYKSLSELAEARNIPKAILLKANKENPPGIGSNNSIAWNLFQPWLSQNYDRLYRATFEDDESEADIDAQLKREKMREEIRRLRIDNGQFEKKILNAALAVARDVTTKWGELIRQKLEYELPVKLGGATELERREAGRKFADELLLKLATPVSQWERGLDE